jgi:hypothetical protein
MSLKLRGKYLSGLSWKKIDNDEVCEVEIELQPQDLQVQLIKAGWVIKMFHQEKDVGDWK